MVVANIYKCATKLSLETAAVLTAKIRATIIRLQTPGAIPWRVSSLSVIHDVDMAVCLRSRTYHNRVGSGVHSTKTYCVHVVLLKLVGGTPNMVRKQRLK